MSFISGKRSLLTPLTPSYLMAMARRLMAAATRTARLLMSTPMRTARLLMSIPMRTARLLRAAAARPSASAAGGIPFARVRTAAGGLIAARASALPRGGWGRGAPSPLLAGEGGAPPLIPARGGPRRSARSVRPLSCADVGGGAPSGLPCRPAPALGLFRAAPPVLPPRARRARV